MGAISGVLPRPGESVLVSPSAGPHIAGNYWFRVDAVRPSSEPGWVYLDGVRLDGLDGPDGDQDREHSLFVRVAGLVIRR